MPSAVGDERAGAGTAPGPDRHAVVLRPVDEVGDDQEVAGETHLHDGLRFRTRAARDRRGRFSLALRCVRIELREAPLQAFAARGRADIRRGRRRPASGIAAAAILPSSSVRLQRLAISTLLASASRNVGEQLGHLRLRLEVLLGAEMTRPALIGQHVAFGDADARLVRAEFVAA